MNHQQKSERDELRARFTVWLETTVYRARLKYLEREKPKVDTVSIEELPVYDQRYQALKKLRIALTKDGDKS